MVYHATLLLLLSWFAQAPQTQVQVTEWEVPWENTRPRDPYYGSGNQIWFVGQRGDYIGLLDPETGDFKRYDLDEGAGPHSVITGPPGPASAHVCRQLMPSLRESRSAWDRLNIVPFGTVSQRVLALVLS